jgi:hypothetical protein
VPSIRSTGLLALCLPACAPGYFVEFASVRDVGGPLINLPENASQDAPAIEFWIVDLESGDDSTELLSMSDGDDGLHVDTADFSIPQERGKYHAIVQFTLIPPQSWSPPREGFEALSFDVVTHRDQPWSVALWDDLELDLTWTGREIYSM